MSGLKEVITSYNNLSFSDRIVFYSTISNNIPFTEDMQSFLADGRFDGGNSCIYCEGTISIQMACLPKKYVCPVQWMMPVAPMQNLENSEKSVRNALKGFWVKRSPRVPRSARIRNVHICSMPAGTTWNWCRWILTAVRFIRTAGYMGSSGSMLITAAWRHLSENSMAYRQNIWEIISYGMPFYPGTIETVSISSNSYVDRFCLPELRDMGMISRIVLPCLLLHEYHMGQNDNMR